MYTRVLENFPNAPEKLLEIDFVSVVRTMILTLRKLEPLNEDIIIDLAVHFAPLQTTFCLTSLTNLLYFPSVVLCFVTLKY